MNSEAISSEQVESSREKFGTAGVTGVGDMGGQIAACLLAAGHSVVAVEAFAEAREKAVDRVRGVLESSGRGWSNQEIESWLQNLQVTDDYSTLADCGVVIESINEDIALKHKVIQQIEEFVKPEAIIGTNTSSLPITALQEGARQPERVIGMHWFMAFSPFLEVILGQQTSDDIARRTLQLAQLWGKQPVLVRKDVPGFIVNRLMYAMIREALHLVQEEVANPQDIDRAFRQVIGVWSPFIGPIFNMEGKLPLFASVMEQIFPDLSNATEPPSIIKERLAHGEIGFYQLSDSSRQEFFARFGELIQAMQPITKQAEEAVSICFEQSEYSGPS